MNDFSLCGSYSNFFMTLFFLSYFKLVGTSQYTIQSSIGISLHQPYKILFVLSNTDEKTIQYILYRQCVGHIYVILFIFMTVRTSTIYFRYLFSFHIFNYFCTILTDYNLQLISSLFQTYFKVTFIIVCHIIEVKAYLVYTINLLCYSHQIPKSS